MTVEIDGKTLHRALVALGWEGLPVYYAKKVRGGVEIATRNGVETWRPPVRRKKRAVSTSNKKSP